MSRLQKPSLRKRLTRFSIGLVGLSFVVAVMLWLVAGRLIAPANRSVGPPPKDLPFAVVQITGESPSPVAGWHLGSGTNQATVILLHPLHGDRRTMLSRARALWAAG